MISEQSFRKKKNGKPDKVCFCAHPELIENYDKAIVDATQIWDCHHRLETHTSDGERRLIELSKKELIALDVYYDRPPEELIFLTRKDHTRLHSKGKKWGPPSEKTRKKISESNKGKHRSDEAKRKISEANKGKHRSEDARRKLSKARKGKYIGEDNPFYGKHHSEETRRKMSESHANKIKVQCVETGQIFESLRSAVGWTGLEGNSGIKRACRNSKYTAAGYHWIHA